MKNLADKIAQLCFDKYNSIKKTGKPKDNEWTVLAGIVLKDCTGVLSVKSLATGTKCLSGADLLDEKRWEVGSRLSDSHAEVLARRAFLRYLYHELDLAFSNTSSDVFEMDQSGEIRLKSHVIFHYFCSQTPCGDCSIFPKICGEDTITVNGAVRKRKIDTSEDLEAKRPTLSEEYKPDNASGDVHRTGAKCVEAEREQDPHLPGINYHVVGPLRIKPGRGDRTLSLSCSDKMAKWNAVGIQGALLSRLIPPIRMTSFSIGGQCPFSLEAMRRGIWERFATKEHCPIIAQSEQGFAHRKSASRTQPCPSSIIWCAVPERQLEVSVDGRKQGVTKKKTRGKNYLSVSRREVFKTFLKAVDKFGKMGHNEVNHPKKITYYHAKHSSSAYQQSWKDLKSKSFQAWPTKPLNLQEFVIT